MRHNLRNKLTIVNGFISDVRHELGSGQESKRAERALSASERLENLTEKMREFDRVKQRDTSFERVDVEAVLDSIEKEFDDGYDTGRIHAALDQDLVVESDPTFLRLAIEELVANALEHTDTEVDVTAGYATDRAELVEISVCDGGPGLSEGEFKLVLDERPTKLEHPAGIGLLIAKWSVDELGGELQFDATDSGTTATVRVPARIDGVASGDTLG